MKDGEVSQYDRQLSRVHYCCRLEYVYEMGLCPIHCKPVLLTNSKFGRVVTQEDEYARYGTVMRPTERTKRPEPTRQENCQNLSKMAVDILTILSTLTALERLFSKTKLAVTDLRN